MNKEQMNTTNNSGMFDTLAELCALGFLTTEESQHLKQCFVLKYIGSDIEAVVEYVVDNYVLPQVEEIDTHASIMTDVPNDTVNLDDKEALSAFEKGIGRLPRGIRREMIIYVLNLINRYIVAREEGRIDASLPDEQDIDDEAERQISKFQSELRLVDGDRKEVRQLVQEEEAKLAEMLMVENQTEPLFASSSERRTTTKPVPIEAHADPEVWMWITSIEKQVVRDGVQIIQHLRQPLQDLYNYLGYQTNANVISLKERVQRLLRLQQQR